MADPDRIFYKVNKLPKKEAYHTFLLNSDNEVVALGNPVTNPKVKEIFVRTVTEATGHENSESESCLCTHPVKPLGTLNAGERVRTRFRMFNRDSIPYSVQGIVTSCDCTTPRCLLLL